MKLVALKILIAEESTDSREERTLEYLQSGGGRRLQHHPGSIHVPRVLHKFRFDGPNGSHLCLVLPLIGPSVSDYASMSEYPYARLDAGLPPYLPKDIALHFARQIIHAVDYLHACGICHGDLKPENVRVQLRNDVETWCNEQVYSRLRKPNRDPVLTVDCEPAGSSEAPEYGVVTPNLGEFGLENLTDIIKIIDYSESFFIDSPPQNPGKTLIYASPENILEGKVSPSSDIWSLACTLFQVCLGGEPLFDTFFDSEDEVLMSMVSKLGKFPAHLWRKWEKRGGYFNEDGTFNIPEREPVPLGEEIRESNNQIIDYENKFSPEHTRKGEVLSEAEMRCFEDFLRKMLRYEQEERISASEALMHPWPQGKFE